MKSLISLLESRELLDFASLKTWGLAYIKQLHPKADEIAIQKGKRVIQFVVVYGEDYEQPQLAEKVGDLWFLDKDFYAFIKDKLPPHDPLDYHGVIQVAPL